MSAGKGKLSSHSFSSRKSDRVYVQKRVSVRPDFVDIIRVQSLKAGFDIQWIICATLIANKNNSLNDILQMFKVCWECLLIMLCISNNIWNQPKIFNNLFLAMVKIQIFLFQTAGSSSYTASMS